MLIAAIPAIDMMPKNIKLIFMGLVLGLGFVPIGPGVGLGLGVGFGEGLGLGVGLAVVFQIAERVISDRRLRLPYKGYPLGNFHPPKV